MKHRSLILIVALATAGPLASGQTTERVSVDSIGQQLTGQSVWPSLSADGRFVAFVTDDPSVIPGDTNGTSDVFVRNQQTGQVVRASITASLTECDGPCFDPVLSADGRFVAFSSWATNLAPTDANGKETDVFVKDLQTGALVHASQSSAGVGGNGISVYHDLSADGRYVTFYSYATNLIATDTNGTTDVFLHDVQTGQTERVSVDSSGTELPLGSQLSQVSANGNLVAFEGFVSTPGPSYGAAAIMVRDRVAGSTTVVSVDSAGNPVHSTLPQMSDDGRWVSFRTAFGLVPEDVDYQPDVYLVDRSTGSLELVSVTSAGQTLPATSSPTSISADGRYIAFLTSGAYDSVDTNGVYDIHVRDRVLSETFLGTLGDVGQPGDAISSAGQLSANGRYLLFFSKATNLVPGDTNGTPDIFLRDFCGDATWANYGQGLAGTGSVVPALTLSADPVIGTTVQLQLGNPLGAATPALLLIGSQKAQTPTPLGGQLLLVPLTSLPLLVPAFGLSQSVAIPDDVGLCGTTILLQSLLVDPGAMVGVAFSAGLEAVPGG